MLVARATSVQFVSCVCLFLLRWVTCSARRRKGRQARVAALHTNPAMSWLDCQTHSWVKFNDLQLVPFIPSCKEWELYTISQTLSSAAKAMGHQPAIKENQKGSFIVGLSSASMWRWLNDTFKRGLVKHNRLTLLPFLEHAAGSYYWLADTSPSLHCTEFGRWKYALYWNVIRQSPSTTGVAAS